MTSASIAYEFDTMSQTGQVVPATGPGVTHVTVPPNPAAFSPPPESTVFGEFDVPNSQLRIHDPEKGWGRVFGPDSLEAKNLQRKGLPTPTAMPPATNIKDATP
jgi:hypothetical protein